MVLINKAVAMFTEFYTYKGYYCPQSSTRKHTLCNDESKGGHYPEEAGGEEVSRRWRSAGGGAGAMGPWAERNQALLLVRPSVIYTQRSWGKGPSVGKKGPDHKQCERQGQERALCPTGSQLHCEALGRAPWDQTQVSKVPLCLQDAEWTGG